MFFLGGVVRCGPLGVVFKVGVWLSACVEVGVGLLRHFGGVGFVGSWSGGLASEINLSWIYFGLRWYRLGGWAWFGVSVGLFGDGFIPCLGRWSVMAHLLVLRRCGLVCLSYSLGRVLAPGCICVCRRSFTGVCLSFQGWQRGCGFGQSSRYFCGCRSVGERGDFWRGLLTVSRALRGCGCGAVGLSPGLLSWLGGVLAFLLAIWGAIRSWFGSQVWYVVGWFNKA